MTFKVIPNPTFPADVTIIGQGAEQTLRVVFRHKESDAYQALLDEMKGDDAPKTLADVLAELIESWNADVDCDRDGIALLGKCQPGSLVAILQTYGDQMVVSRKKN